MAAEDYRRRATDLSARAEAETLTGRRALYLQMAKSWSRLAEQAEKTHETPTLELVGQAEQQRQNQPQVDEGAPNAITTPQAEQTTEPPPADRQSLDRG
jgi:hypothetical protein